MRRPRIDTGEPPVVLVTFPDYDTDDPSIGGALDAAGYVMRIAPKHGKRSTAELLALCSDASGAIVSTDPFTAEVLRDCPNLQVVARVGVGVDTVDVSAATEMGVAVTTTPGANADSVADHAIALMLAVLRRIAINDASVRRGEWNRTGKHTAGQLTGATVGLVGYGDIGRRVVRRLAGFDVELLVTDPAVGAESPHAVDLAELLSRADIVSVHCPLLPSTRHLIDDEALHRMQPHAILVNTARGEVIDEEALFRALKEGVIGGAGIDAFTAEPPHDSPLLELPNVVLSPHIGGLSDVSIATMLRIATASVVDVIEGRVPAGLYNRAILD